jgi:hypothetical protein
LPAVAQVENAPSEIESTTTVSVAEKRLSSASSRTAPNLSRVRRDAFRRKRPSRTAAMKISTSAAAISIATWKRRFPIVGSIRGPALIRSVSARHAVAVRAAA